MNTNCLKQILVLPLLLALVASFTAPAQDTNTNPPAQNVDTSLEIKAPNTELKVVSQVKLRRGHHSDRDPKVRVGGDFHLKEGEESGEVVVVFGQAQIDGTVDGDVVSVLGGVTFGSNAVVKGDTYVIAGPVTIPSTNTSLQGELVVVGGRLDAPEDFKPGGELVHPPFDEVIQKFDWLLGWLKEGLLYGRPIAPGIGWVWAVAAILLLVHFLLNLLFDRPLRVCAATLDAKPLTAFLAGLLVLVLFGPVCILLLASGIGIIVLPFLGCALLLASLFGKLAVARWTGGNVARRGTPEQRFAPVRSFLIGALVIYFLYVIPIVGFATWAMIRVLGLGAATLAMLHAFKREHPPAGTKVPAPAGPALTTQPAPATVVNAAAGESGVAANPGGGAEAAATPPLSALAATAGLAQPDLATLPRGTFGIRLAAFLLDLLLVSLIYSGLGLSEDHGMGLFISIFLVYWIALWTWRGTSIGGLVCNLRLVRVDTRPLRFADTLVRGLASIFSAAAFGLGFLWVIWDDEKQTWHDKIAGTYVVRVPRSAPLL